MAAVYLCRDDQGQAVAVKWLDLCLPGEGPEAESLTPPLLRRYEAEVRALSRVDHPGVVHFRDQGQWLGRPYLVMDHVEGSDLRVYTEKLRQRPPAERYARCRTIGQALCEAVGALHQAGLVHRDVKPSNVLVDPAGRVVLTDLGVVKDLMEQDRTQVGLVVGTIAYAAPEQLEGLDVDARTDLYGVGATLYTLLTGRRPFERGRRQEPAELVPPSRLDPELPPDLEAVILRLMAPRPGDRFPDAQAAALAFSNAGDPVGQPLAGRAAVIEGLTRHLDLAEDEGGSLVLRVRGPIGVGRHWLAGVLRRAAAGRGLTVVEPAPGAATRVALERAALEPGVIVLSPEADIVTLPQGAHPLRQAEITLSPLGVADLRRTVVAAAPLTADPSAVALRLHAWSGGLPALLLPLLSHCDRGARLVLPETCPVLPAAEPFLEGLELDDMEVLATIAALRSRGGAASVAEIEQVSCLPPEDALATLAARGILRPVEGRWALCADMFGQAAMERHPDPEALLARVARLPAVDAAVAGSGAPDPGRLALDGHLAEALLAAEQAVARAQAGGDRGAEAEAMNELGQVLLDLGRVEAGRRTLANASALAKAAERPQSRHRAHVLRARATLDGLPPGSSAGRAAAASALDRLVPLAAGAEERDEPLDALLFATWARAAAAIGDRRAAQIARDRAIARLDRLDDDLHSRTCLELARAALAGNDDTAPLLARLRPGQLSRGLVGLEAARVRARAQGEPLPEIPAAWMEGLGD